MIHPMTTPAEREPTPDLKRLNVHRHFATVQVTLLSIVVALVLENLLARIWETGAPGIATIQDWVTWLQIALVLASALTTWSGFAFGLIFVENKNIHAIEFIAPFALLISMQVAIRYLYPEPVYGFLLAMASASAVATLLLVSEIREMSAKHHNSPVSAAIGQAAISALHLAAAALLYGQVIAQPGAVVFLSLGCAAQLFALRATFSGWRTASSQSA